MHSKKGESLENGFKFKKQVLKVVVVGDGAVGKTCLCVTYQKGEFPDEDYLPTICDNFEKPVKYKNKYDFTLQLWDTGGQELFKKIRALSYPDTDCFVVCFSLIDRESLENVKEKWYEDLTHEDVSHTPMVLVGCKHDLVGNFRLSSTATSTQVKIEEEEIEEVQDHIGAFEYFECSSKTGFNVDRVFQSTVNYIAMKEMFEAENEQAVKNRFTTKKEVVEQQQQTEEEEEDSHKKTTKRGNLKQILKGFRKKNKNKKKKQKKKKKKKGILGIVSNSNKFEDIAEMKNRLDMVRERDNEVNSSINSFE